MADWEDKTGNGEGGPAVEWRLVTHSNTAYISRPRGLYVDVTGTLSVEDSLGNIMPMAAAAVGYHPLRPVRVRATGTTAVVYALY